MTSLGKNIVLTGMMGSGKTTIGKMLSEKLNMDFIDLDEYIEKSAGRSIPEIFKIGEEYFRTLETEAAADLSGLSSTIISTGGGIIKRNINIELLKKNGIIFFIDRPIENIAVDIKMSTRPLLSGGIGKLYEIFNERYSIYRSSSDIVIKNDKGIDDAVDSIVKNYINICKAKN